MSRLTVPATVAGLALTRAGPLAGLLLLAGAAACTVGRPDTKAIPTSTPSLAVTVAARLPDTATSTPAASATREPATVTATPTPTPTPTATPTETTSPTFTPTALSATPTSRPATPTSVPPTTIPATPRPQPATPTPPVERPRPLPVPTNPPVAGPASTVLVLALDAAGRVINFGSGVPVSADGLVVTSQRAIVGARQLAIRQASGAAGPARIVLSDTATGLVVLHATAGQLQVATLGEAAALHPGDPVIAGGFASSSSAVPARSVGQAAGPQQWAGGGVGNSALPFVAGIAPGFTGGPLLDTSGRVVGIVTDPAAGGGVASAVPVERARDLIARAQIGGANPAPAVPYREPVAVARPGDAVAAVINRYYDALSAGDYSAAYALLSRSARASQSFASFVSQFASTASIEAGAPVIVSIDNRQAIAQVQTITTYHVAGSTYRQHWQITWYLVLEDGEWRRESLDQVVLTAPTPVSG